MSPPVTAFRRSILAEQVGQTGTVVGIDVSRGQVANARAIQRAELPWLRFECHDMRALPASFPAFQRITGNLSVCFSAAPF